MKMLMAAVSVALLALAAQPAKAQPVSPIESLFGALLGAPARALSGREAYRNPYARQSYDRYGFRGAPRGYPYAAPRVAPRQAAIPPARSVDPRYRRQVVNYDGGHSAGTIVVDTRQRFLFLVQSDGTALRYGIGVGREGFEWNGTAKVGRKAEWPDWHPPAAMRKREPWLPVKMEGGPENPLGARALYLFQGSKDTLYRIHGTNQPHTIGQAVSSGCIRMLNDDVADLYERVANGTKVVVI